jgi:subtilisin family serine protease
MMELERCTNKFISGRESGNMKSLLSFATLLMAIVATTTVSDAGSVSRLVDPQLSEKFHDRLADIIKNAGPNDLIPVTIVMREQASRDQIQQLAAIRNKELRRQAVIGLLQATAANSQDQVLDLLAERRAEGKVGLEITPLWIHNVIGAQITPGVAFEIAARDDVDYLNDDATIGRSVFPTQISRHQIAPGPEGNVECGVALMGAPQVWSDFGITGQNVVVCVVDTGCCLTHPDIQGQVWVNTDEIPGNNIDDDQNGHIDDINGWNFRNNTSNIADDEGHGTHVSGTTVGDGDNGIQTGMAPDAKLMTCKFWNNFAGEQVAWNCIQYGVNNGAHVMNGSYGWPHSFAPDRPTWRMVVENAIAAGVVMVFAAGNEGGSNPPDNVRTPGDVPNVITAGATSCSDVIAGFSSRGPVTWQNIPPYLDWPYPPGKIKPTVSAPGVATVSTSSNCSGYLTLDGTSMASPHIAGAVALILAANPNLDHLEVKQILKDTALDLGANGPDNNYGAGRVDVYDAVVMALSMLETRADSMTVFRGVQIAGSLSDTFQSDNSYVKFQPGITLNPSEPPVWLIFDATLPDDSPSSLTVTLESKVNTVNLQQRVEMFNWNTNSYVLVNAQNVGLSDGVVNIDVSSGIANYVQAGTGAVRTRVGYRTTGVISLFPWTVCIDQIVWD